MYWPSHNVHNISTYCMVHTPLFGNSHNISSDFVVIMLCCKGWYLLKTDVYPSSFSNLTQENILGWLSKSISMAFWFPNCFKLVKYWNRKRIFLIYTGCPRTVERKPFPTCYLLSPSPPAPIWNHLKLLSLISIGNFEDSAQTEYCSTFHCSCVRPCVRVSQAWHLTFLTYIKA